MKSDQKKGEIMADFYGFRLYKVIRFLSLYKRLLILTLVLIEFNLCHDGCVYGADNIGYHHTLDEFANVDDFEKNYNGYIQKCLDESGGGTGGIYCLIESAIWDRELNIQYKKLYSILSDSERGVLREAQKQWIVMRDKNIEMERSLIKERNDGTMYVLIREGDIDKLTAKMVKERTLYIMYLISVLKSK